MIKHRCCIVVIEISTIVVADGGEGQPTSGHLNWERGVEAWIWWKTGKVGGHFLGGL